MDLNKVMVIGRLPQDPELRNLPSGKSVCSFAVATGRRWVDKTGGKQQDTEFHRVVAWGKLAETVSQYLTKGRQVYIEGRLQTHDWTGDDGVRRYRTEVVADSLIMLGNKPVEVEGKVEVVRGTVRAEGGEESPEEVIEEEIKVEELPF